MARQIGDGNRIDVANFINPDSGPLSISLWGYADSWNTESGTTDGNIIFQQEGGSGRTWLLVRTSTPFILRSFIGGSATDGATDIESRLGEWIHYGMSTASGASGTVRVYLDGVEDGSATKDPESETSAFRIGSHKSPSTSQEEWFGRLAELAVWNRELSAGEFASLGARFSPLCFPNGLASYVPGVRDLIDRKGNTLTNFGSTVGVHPPIIYPTQPISGFAIVAGGDLDTENKRRSGITPNTHVLMPLPDGTIIAVDRQQAAWVYSGIAAAGAAERHQTRHMQQSWGFH